MTGDAGRWDRVKAVFQAALERPLDARPAFLDETCGSDQPLRTEVESLLRAHEAAGDFAEQPALLELAGRSLQRGDRLGPYEIGEPLGAGGMGEVYSARDTKLRREVAIKVLPPLFTMDADRLARFEREARVLASLNHPHIGAIYGLENVDGVPALVLELVEGPTLADRLAKGPVPLRDALTIAAQIAQAFEAAHERGIVHRDLKPANIKLRPDGAVKVLDFGLAKVTTGGSSAGATQPPTTDIDSTREGVILGTAPYMSPEQAQGQPADARSDIWAFGVVLYEMLVGKRAFAGTTTLEILSNVLKTEPDWAALPPSTPPTLRSLLRRCLQKDRAHRLRDIADARFQIEEALNEPAIAAAVSTQAVVPRKRERLLWVAALVGAITAGVAGGATYLLRAGQPQADEVRLDITAPPTTDPTSLAISPNGKMIAFAATADGKSLLWVRALDAVSAHPLAGTENAKFPFWSPDGRSVGFATGAQLKRVDIGSGSVQVVVSGGALGGAWNRDGTILYDTGPGGQLSRVSADGGEPVAVTKGSLSATDPWFPQFLPDQRHFLFYATGAAPGIYAGQLDATDAPRRIIEAQAATYASSGHLLFVRQGTLFAQVFDPVRMNLTGSATVIAEHVLVGQQQGEAALSASAAGPIIFRTGSGAPSQFVWFDRAGKALETVAGSDSGDGYNSSLSPNGLRLAFSRFATAGGTTDIWVLNLSRGVADRLTTDPAFELMPVWSPDGKRMAFTSNRKQAGGSEHMRLYVRSVTSIGNDELLVRSDENSNTNPSDWSPDGRFILFVKCKTDCGIWALPMDGDRIAFPVVETAFNETNPQFSPDGKWIAYQSNESGGVEIYVQPFPGPGRKTRVSGDGGIQARWRRDGKELFYLAPDNRLMAVPIQLDAPADSVDVGTPAPLFATHLGGTPRNYMSRSYMVDSAGQRFLVDTLKEVTLPVTVLLNWKPK